MSSHFTYYVNADFDLSLRSRTSRLERPVIARQVDELSIQALLGASADDSALIRGYLPADYLDYLNDRGIPVPRVLTHPEIDASTVLRPFGWNAEAIELNRRHRTRQKHPDLATVTKVNSRSFALELDDHGTLIRSADALESFLSNAQPDTQWIVKAEHGNSALANRRLRSTSLSTGDRRFVGALFDEDDRAVIEPWRERERDFSVVFDVPFDPGTVRVHETIHTGDGALIGALFEPGGPVDSPYDGELRDAAKRTASRLQNEGYFGPVCMDAFSWNDRGRRRLRPVVDLNCRRPMSDPAYRLWRDRYADQTMLYRFFNAKKLNLPRELPDDDDLLFASPTLFSRVAVIFTGADRDRVRAMESRFRDRHER